jgi:hypothetical protein
MDSLGLTRYGPLNPFKNKPPLPGWYVIGLEDADHWLELAEIAYDQMKYDAT